MSAAAAAELLQRLGGQLRGTALEIIGGDGGVLVLALGLVGLGVLAIDVVRLVTGAVGRRRRRGSRKPTRAARARTLIAGGCAPTEIARQTGLPRDAVCMLVAPEADTDRTPAVAAAADCAGVETLVLSQPAAAPPRIAARAAAQSPPLRLTRTSHRQRLGEAV